jgi:predicted DNA-binding transcriptional regulator YafY
MRHEKAEQVLAVARLLAANAEGLTLDEIAQRMEVSRRTAERLRDAVARVFPQMEEKPDGSIKRFCIPGGIESFFNSPTTEELLALSKAVAHFKRAAMKEDGAALAGLEQKILAAMRPQALRKVSPDLEALMRAELIAVQAGPRAVEAPELLAVLREALLRTRVVAFTYFGGSKKGATRKVAPYGIIFGRMNYLVGPETGGTKIKHWRLDRIRDLKPTDEVSSAPEDFSLTEYAQVSFGFFHEEPEDVVLRVLNHEIDDNFERWQFHPKQTVEYEPDGSAIVRFRASGMLELAWHLFTWENKVQVIQPTSLREKLTFELAKALTFHESPVAPAKIST